MYFISGYGFIIHFQSTYRQNLTDFHQLLPLQRFLSLVHFVFLLLILDVNTYGLSHDRSTFVLVVLWFFIFLLKDTNHLEHLKVKKIVNFERIHHCKCTDCSQKALKVECVKAKIIQPDLKTFPYNKLE